MNGKKITDSLVRMLEKGESGLNEFDKMLLCHKKKKDQRQIKADYTTAKVVSKLLEGQKEVPLWVWYMEIKSVHTMKNLVLYCLDK